MNQANKKTGPFLVITGATLRGVGGTVSQKLFQQYAIDVNWPVTVRLLIAGLLLLTVQGFKKDHSQAFDISKNKKTSLTLIISGWLGQLGFHYKYMAPVMIIAYLLLSKQTLLTRRDLLTVLLALVGCFFLLTNGFVSQLSVPVPAIVWGVLSGVALAFYTLYAVSLLAQYDSLVVV